MSGAKETMTNNEAAEYLRVKPQTLAKWRCRDYVGIPYYKIRGHIIYSRSDLDKYLAAHRHEG